MVYSSLTNRVSGNAGQYSGRGGRAIRGWIFHHAATTSMEAVLAMMRTGDREVSANYVLGDGQIISVVPEEFRAFTSASPNADGANLTVEIVNNKVGSNDSNWTIAEAEYHNMAKLVAETSSRYGFSPNGIGHRDVIKFYGQGYATACPSGVDVGRILNMAVDYQKSGYSNRPPVSGNVATGAIAQNTEQFKIFQRKLMEIGHTAVRDNGILDKATKDSTAHEQSVAPSNGYKTPLDVDGIPGWQTNAYLDYILPVIREVRGQASKPTPKPKPSSPIIQAGAIKQGTKEFKIFQDKLIWLGHTAVKANGVLDKATKDSTAHEQSVAPKNGYEWQLDVDGVPGWATNGYLDWIIPRVDAARKKAAANKQVHHTVAKGETLYGISKKYGTTVGKIQSLNGMGSSTVIKPGQKLRVK